MSKLFKAQMHERPTYETLVKYTILEPKDKIALPDRSATILRRTQQLSRYDDAEFLDLEKDQENISKDQAQQIRIRASIGADPGGSIAEERAIRPNGHASHDFSNQPPPGPPPSGGPPRFKGGGQGRMPSRPPSQTIGASTSGPPPPPTNGTKIMAASASTQTPKPQQFDMTINDDMQDAQDGTAKVLAEREQTILERRIAIAEQIANHLGPQYSTTDQSYVARLTELGSAGRARFRRRKGEGMPMEVSNNDQQMPPPPPPSAPIVISGGKAPTSIRIRGK